MENKILVELELKYGFSPDQVNKVVDISSNLGIEEIESSEFNKMIDYIVKHDLIEKSSEEIVEDLRLKKIV